MESAKRVTKLQNRTQLRGEPSAATTRNRIKRKLERGEIVNVIEGFHTAEIVDFLGPMGFDGVWVETEHGAIDFREIQNITRSCDLWGMTSLIRVNRVDYGLIYRTLDQGAQGVIVPHVDTAEQAREVVRAARYAPIGARGMYESRQAYPQTEGSIPNSISSPQTERRS